MLKSFNLSEFLLTLLTLVFSITVHEWAHAVTADFMGDPTPRSQGRVTLWPGAHLDPIGTVMMVASTFMGFGLGWGKPVISDPNAYTRLPRRIAGFLVVFAGPLSNLTIAAVFAQILRFHLSSDDFTLFFVWIIVSVNILLFLFNLLPVAPLDGSKLVAYALPEPMGIAFLQFMQRMGFLFLGLLLFTNVLDRVLGPAELRLFALLTGAG